MGLILLVVSPVYAGAQQTAATASIGVAEALVEAFNQHDAEAMALLVTRDFELYYMDESGGSSLATSGPDALRDEMTAYFTARPGVRSEIVGALPGSRFVAFREQIVGGASSIAVYEIAEGRVRRAWYFPAEEGG